MCHGLKMWRNAVNRTPQPDFQYIVIHERVVHNKGRLFMNDKHQAQPFTLLLRYEATAQRYDNSRGTLDSGPSPVRRRATSRTIVTGRLSKTAWNKTTAAIR